VDAAVDGVAVDDIAGVVMVNSLLFTNHSHNNGHELSATTAVCDV